MTTVNLRRKQSEDFPPLPGIAGSRILVARAWGGRQAAQDVTTQVQELVTDTAPGLPVSFPRIALRLDIDFVPGMVRSRRHRSTGVL